MAHWIQKRKSVLLWLLVTIGLSAWLGHVLLQAEDKTLLLPGKTTHGHYQIEMACSACHTAEEKENVFTSSGVPNSACTNCHGEDLNQFSDSHPTRKFKNPENAIFLEHVNAMNCVECHAEHNEKITHDMGVTIPQDYCAHCHQVTLENLESHQNLKFHTCATAGCHNYHDNMALAPSFLLKHYGEANNLKEQKVAEVNALQRWLSEGNKKRAALTIEEADAPSPKLTDPAINLDWEHTAHAAAGINCSDCHDDPVSGVWMPAPDHHTCKKCHDVEVTDFLKGKHGMRLAHPELSPMTPTQARQSLKATSAHRDLSCSSCHQPHRYDREFAAHQACIQCHDDEHTRNYDKSPHFALWAAELAGTGEERTGVSCATCHLPREERDDHHVVNHNQNANLTPNEKMIRNVCMDCHGLQFAMDAMADREVIADNFSTRPTKAHPGISWTVDAAIKRGNEEIIALKNYLESPNPSPPENAVSPPPTTTQQNNSRTNEKE
ncbi:cytochrome c3 family protein [Roseibacillus persicicus]|uniref:nitrite reductase (cytochrome; ammonia-forming) n=1 Tax=Roseibacillus persicicus TaxID=454148 RepID=A0A918THP6_9BACT|nr:cytochrome c3 family protein [Roseibacillus persicicus]GHC49715.1 NrfA- nitrite reduction protein [Roseibacillus persicicus]